MPWLHGKRFLLGVLLVCAIVATVHWPVLSAQALCFDDREFLSDNPLVQNPSLASAGRFISEALNPTTVGGYYIPFTMISLMVDYAAGGRPDDLGAFHRTNLLLHLLTAAAIAVLLNMLFSNPPVALILALLYGLHPLTVEPVVWIGERKTVLATCLAAWTIVAHLQAVRRESTKWRAVSVLLFLLSLLAKPTTTTLPVLLLLLDYWPLRRFDRKAVLEKIPYFVVAVAMGMLTILSNARGRDIAVGGHAEAGPLPLRICYNLMLYATKLILPMGMTPYYSPPNPFNLSNFTVVGGVLGTALLLGILALSWRWTRCWVTGSAFFFIAIAPTLGFIEFSWILASDKYVYFPALGLLLPLAWCLKRWWAEGAAPPAGKYRRAAIVVAVIVLSAAWSFQTRNYLTRWRGSEGLYRYMLARAPGVPVIQYSLANTLSEEGKTDEAAAEYLTCIQSSDHYPEPYVGLGKILYERGDAAGAIQRFHEALSIYPDHLQANDNLGAVLSAIGRTDEAEQHLRRAIRINPNYASPYYNLAMNLQRQGRQQDAVAHYRTALGINPGFYQAAANLASLYGKLGQWKEAVYYYRQALVSSGGHPTVRERLINAEKMLQQQGGSAP